MADSRLRRRWVYVVATAAGGAAQEVTIQLPNYFPAARVQLWNIHAVRFARTAGTAANYTLLIGNAAAFGATSINRIISYGATAVATPINETFTAPIPVQTDANNRLYFRPTWDAGADNTANVVIVFEALDGTTG